MKRINLLLILICVAMLALVGGCKSQTANNPGSAYVAQHRRIHDQYKFVVDRFAGYEQNADVRQGALDLWQSEEVLIRSAERANATQPTTAPVAAHH